MLITLVENSIKHGIEPLPEGGHISVTAEREAHPDGPRIALSVVDTGAGDGGAQGDGGIGLANIRERLALLFGERATLATEANAPRGFTARLVLPLEPVPARATVASFSESAAR
jgi:sensor histidine kinase YesM